MDKWWLRTVFTALLPFVLSRNEEHNRVARQNDDDRFKGHPEIQSCDSEEAALSRNFTPSFELTIFPKWTNWTESQTNPLKNYTWSYKTVEVTKKNGKEIETPLDTSNWLKQTSASGVWLHIPKYGLQPGHYKVYPEGVPKNPGDILNPPQPSVCHLIVNGAPPVVIISGGTSRIVSSGKEIFVNGDQTYNANIKEKTKEQLEYYWNCTQKMQPPTFCNHQPVSTKSKLTIPAEYVREGDTFTMTLTVETLNQSASATQIIESRNNIANLEITCEKNCPPVSDISNYGSVTFLRVTCISNCHQIKTEHYEWTIERQDDSNYKFDYKRNTQFGRTGPKFFIFKNVFQPGEYSATVKLPDYSVRTGEAAYTLSFVGPPEVTDCGIRPETGQSLETPFTLYCHQEENDRANFYELLARDRNDPRLEKILMDGYFPQVFDNEFALPPSIDNDFIVKVSFQNGPRTALSVTANVKRSQSSVGLLDSFYNGEEPVADLLSSGNMAMKEKGIRKFHAMVDQIVATQNDDDEVREFIEDLKYKATVDLLNAPISSYNEIMQMGEAVTNLMTYDELPRSDPLLAKFSTTVCKKMMNKHMDMLRNEKYPLNSADKANKVSKTLNRCFETNTNANFEIIAPVEYNFTTEMAVLAEAVATEDYANYEDFSEEYYKNLEYLKEATYNIISATGTSAKAIAMTTAVGEKFVEIFGNQSATVVAKDTGDNLAKSKIVSKGVVLLPSPDLAEEEHNYDILVSTWNKDIMWWNRLKIRAATNIASVQFWHTNCKLQISNFSEPAQIIFTIKEDVDFQIVPVNDTFMVPRNYPSIAGEDLSRIIKVRRVVVPRRQTLRIQITDLLPEDALNVVVTKFSFPSVEDFSNSTEVKIAENTFFTLTNGDDFDAWYYIGVLASNSSVPDDSSLRSISYTLTLTRSCCIYWVESESSWLPGCVPIDVVEDNIIKCACQHFSVIAGYLTNVDSLLQEVVPAELEMEFHANSVIFLALATSFGLYCLLLIFVVIQKKNEVFYLADNNINHRFAYLIEIKTGGGLKSGTTSNITIRLVGVKHSSDPHVLNYPDPKLRLLQNFGHDLFLLTTEYHLGKLVQIELWFDCIGPNPDWFCKEMIVYDLQQYSKWCFKVGKRLELLKGEVYVQLVPMNSVNRIKFVGQYYTWCLWHREEHFSYVKRLTVLLSTVLTIFVIALVLYEVPTFQLHDGFDVKYQVDTFVVHVALISSSLAFLCHFLVSWCFRCSKLQYAKHNQGRKLPFLITGICWTVLTTVIITSTTFLIVTGFYVPYNKSLQWLTSSIAGIVLDTMLYENVFGFIQSVACKLEKKLSLESKFRDVWHATEAQRRLLCQKFGDALLRPYFRHLYVPLKVPIIEEKRKIVAHRRNVISELEDLVMFGIYVVILYIVILANKDNFIVLGKTEMEELMEGLHTRTLGFTGVESILDLYQYVNTTLIPSMQPSVWYGNYVLTEPALMGDATNKFIGIARFRQHRMETNSCAVPESMEFIQKSCVSEFSIFHAYTGIFGYAKQASISYLSHDRLREIWTYSAEKETGSLTAIGEFATYSGGGYVAYLGRTLYNSYANFVKISEKFWIDAESRSIFIEFLTYNVNYNVFNSVKLLFEQSASGYTFQSIEVYAARMLFVENEVAMITSVFLFLFVAWVTMLSLKYSVGVVRKIRSFYKDLWLLTDLVIVAMSITCISLFVLRMIMIKLYLDKLETMKHNEFLNYFYLFYLEDFLTTFAAALVCIATLRLWKFLRFGLLFRILERTISLTVLPLLAVTFCYVVLAMAFAISIVMLHGNNYEKINSVVRTIRLLIIMVFGANDIQLTEFSGTLVAFYLAIYSLLVKVIFVLLITVIVISYAEAQMEFSGETEVYNIKHYIQEQVKYIPRFLRYKYSRLKSGQDLRNKVQAKADKFVYLNSFSISKKRMRTMQYIAQYVIRNIQGPRQFDHSDVKLILKLCLILLVKNETDFDVFFRGRIQGKKMVLVDEQRITKIAKIVGSLLEDTKHSEPTTITVAGTECDRIVKQNLNCLKKCDLMLRLVFGKLNDFC